MSNPIGYVCTKCHLPSRRTFCMACGCVCHPLYQDDTDLAMTDEAIASAELADESYNHVTPAPSHSVKVRFVDGGRLEPRKVDDDQ